MIRSRPFIGPVDVRSGNTRCRRGWRDRARRRCDAGVDRVWIALPLAVFAACGSGFVEPNPPMLSTVVVERPIPATMEPVVFQLILDLQVPDDFEACETARSRLRNVLGGSSIPALQNAMVLPTEEFLNESSPCAQSAARRLDAPKIRARMNALIASEPGFHIRPLILYANGSEVPLTRELLGDFRDLLQPLSNGLAPLFWIVTSKSVAHQLTGDREIEWTFATDDAVMSSITALAEQELPLWTSDASSDPGAPLLSQSLLEQTRAIKICQVERLHVEGAPIDGTTADVDPTQPPSMRIQIPPLIAQPRSLATPSPAKAVVEICADRCERFVPDEQGALDETWRAKAGCALTGRTP